jgi:hypothetical protein
MVRANGVVGEYERGRRAKEYEDLLKADNFRVTTNRKGNYFDGRWDKPSRIDRFLLSEESGDTVVGRTIFLGPHIG